MLTYNMGCKTSWSKMFPLKWGHDPVSVIYPHCASHRNEIYIIKMYCFYVVFLFYTEHGLHNETKKTTTYIFQIKTVYLFIQSSMFLLSWRATKYLSASLKMSLKRLLKLIFVVIPHLTIKGHIDLLCWQKKKSGTILCEWVGTVRHVS